MENFRGLDSGLGSSGFNLLSVTQTLLFLRRSKTFYSCVGHIDLFLFVSVTQTCSCLCRSHRPCSSCVDYTEFVFLWSVTIDQFCFVSVIQTLFFLCRSHRPYFLYRSETCSSPKLDLLHINVKIIVVKNLLRRWDSDPELPCK